MAATTVLPHPSVDAVDPVVDGGRVAVDRCQDKLPVARRDDKSRRVAPNNVDDAGHVNDAAHDILLEKEELAALLLKKPRLEVPTAVLLCGEGTKKKTKLVSKKLGQDSVRALFK